MRPESLARAHLAARNYGFAESVARKAVQQNANQVPPLAALVEILHAVGKEKEAIDAYRQLSRWRNGPTATCPSSAGSSRLWPGGSRTRHGNATAPVPSAGTEESTIDRIDLNTLGPLVWSPFPAPPLAGTDTTGRTWSLADLKHQGKNVLVIFFLGGKCAHCMQQLQVFGKEYEALRKLNVETLAVSTDDAEATRSLKNNADGIKFPMPMLADPRLDDFKRFRVFDDFENQPLHGTFLIDADGQHAVPAHLRRPVPRGRVHQDRGGAGEYDVKRQTAKSRPRPGKGELAAKRERRPPCPSWTTFTLPWHPAATGNRFPSTGQGPWPTP